MRRQLITTSAMIVDAYGIISRNSDGKLPWLLSVVAVASQNPKKADAMAEPTGFPFAMFDAERPM